MEEKKFQEWFFFFFYHGAEPKSFAVFSLKYTPSIGGQIACYGANVDIAMPFLLLNPQLLCSTFYTTRIKIYTNAKDAAITTPSRGVPGRQRSSLARYALHKYGS